MADEAFPGGLNKTMQCPSYSSHRHVLKIVQILSADGCYLKGPTRAFVIYYLCEFIEVPALKCRAGLTAAGTQLVEAHVHARGALPMMMHKLSLDKSIKRTVTV